METGTQKSVAMAELTPIMTDIAAFAGTIESIDVCDEETQGQMGDFVKMMNSRRRKIEDKRTSLVKPLNGVVNDINDLFKGPRERIDQLIAMAKGKMDSFAQAQQMIAEAARKAEQEAAEKDRLEAQELADALAKKVGKEEAAPVQVVVEQAEKRVEEAAAPAQVKVNRGMDSSISTVKTWKAEVIDVLLIAKGVASGRLPVDVLEVNMRALNDISKEMKQDIEVDGVHYYLDVKTQVR